MYTSLDMQVIGSFRYNVLLSFNVFLFSVALKNILGSFGFFMSNVYCKSKSIWNLTNKCCFGYIYFLPILDGTPIPEYFTQNSIVVHAALLPLFKVQFFSSIIICLFLAANFANASIFTTGRDL